MWLPCASRTQAAVLTEEKLGGPQFGAETFRIVSCLNIGTHSLIGTVPDWHVLAHFEMKELCLKMTLAADLNWSI